MSGKTSFTCWRAKCCETASLKFFFKLIHTIRMLFFSGVSGGHCNQLIVMYPDITYTRKINISILKQYFTH